MIESIFFSLLIFFFGASLGSFISVLNYRIKNNKKGILFGFSVSEHTGRRLKTWELIPIISYAILGGKDRVTKQRISPHYIFLEIITGLVVLCVFLKYPFLNVIPALSEPVFMWNMFVPFCFYTVYSIFLIAVFFYDLQNKEIPDLYLWPFFIIAVTGTFIMGTPTIINAFISLVIAAGFFGSQHFLSKGKWLGDGDLYLSLSLAVILGWKLFIVAVIAAYFSGAIISIILLASKNSKLKSAIPFGPFLVIGTFAAIFFGNEIISWYLSTIVF